MSSQLTLKTTNHHTWMYAMIGGFVYIFVSILLTISFIFYYAYQTIIISANNMLSLYASIMLSLHASIMLTLNASIICGGHASLIAFCNINLASLKDNRLLYLPSLRGPLNEVMKTSFVACLQSVSISFALII